MQQTIYKCDECKETLTDERMWLALWDIGLACRLDGDSYNVENINQKTKHFCDAECLAAYVTKRVVECVSGIP